MKWNEQKNTKRNWNGWDLMYCTVQCSAVQWKWIKNAKCKMPFYKKQTFKREMKSINQTQPGNEWKFVVRCRRKEKVGKREKKNRCYWRHRRKHDFRIIITSKRNPFFFFVRSDQTELHVMNPCNQNEK